MESLVFLLYWYSLLFIIIVYLLRVILTGMITKVSCIVAENNDVMIIYFSNYDITLNCIILFFIIWSFILNYHEIKYLTKYYFQYLSARLQNCRFFICKNHFAYKENYLFLFYSRPFRPLNNFLIIAWGISGQSIPTLKCNLNHFL